MKFAIAMTYTALILATLLFYENTHCAAATGARVKKTPISLAIVYHRQKDPKSTEDKPATIDNGAIPGGLQGLFASKTAAILVNGIIAHSIFTAMATYHAGACSSLARNWDNLCSQESPLILNYTPYLVMAPNPRLPEKPYTDTTRPLSDERFVLFLQNDKRAEIEPAFNMRRLRRVDWNNPNQLDKIKDLEKIVSESRPNVDMIAATIRSIFSTQNPARKTSEQQYSWNIFIVGHGFKINETDLPIFVRSGFSHKSIVPTARSPETSLRYQQEFEQELKNLMLQEGLDKQEAERLKKEFEMLQKLEMARQKQETMSVQRIMGERAEIGVIANMPPREFILLLDFFNTMPTNIVLLISCFGGGYNFFLMSDALKLISQLPGHTGTGQARPFIFTSLAAFDATTAIHREVLKRLVIELDELFSNQTQVTAEDITKILQLNCNNPALLLMPETTAKPQLLIGPTCDFDNINFTIDRLTSLYSIKLLFDALNPASKPAQEFKNALFQKALKQNVGLALNMIFEYQEELLGTVRSSSDLNELLKFAVSTKNKRAITKLLEHGADPNTPITIQLTTSSQTLSIFAYAIIRQAFDAAELLLQHGAHVNVLALHEQPLLITLILGSRTSTNANRVIDMVLAHKELNLDATDHDGETALSLSIKHSLTDIVKKLLTAGAKIREQDLELTHDPVIAKLLQQKMAAGSGAAAAEAAHS